MRRLVTITLPCLFLMLVGCGTTPNPRFYALTSAPAPPASSSTTMTVAVGPVTIPAAVDRPQIVLTTGPNRVRLEEFDRWAAPLQNDIARAVAANLVAALGTSRVMLASAPVTLTPEVLQAAIPVSSDVRLMDVVRALDADGVEVLEIERRGASLDDVFLSVTGSRPTPTAGDGDDDRDQEEAVA